MSISEIKDIATIAQSAATVIAIILGGWWTYSRFLKKREPYPRVKIEHHIFYKSIIKGKMLLSLGITISNIGNVWIRLESGEVKVSQILPPRDELLDIIKGNQGVMVTNWQALAVQYPTWKKNEFVTE